MVPVQNPVKIREDLRGLEVSAGRPVTVWILSGLLLGLQIRGLQGFRVLDAKRAQQVYSFYGGGGGPRSSSNKTGRSSCSCLAAMTCHSAVIAGTRVSARGLGSLVLQAVGGGLT